MKKINLFNKKWKKYTFWSVVFIFCIVTYFLSYPVILPIMEKCRMGKFAYFIYEPVELLRLQSDTYWKFTEFSYRSFMPRKSSNTLERSYFKEYKRRDLKWDMKGNKFHEFIYWNHNGDDLFQITIW